MLFTTPLFLFVFLPLFLSCYYIVPKAISIKNIVALIGSILFFAWGEPIFVIMLLFGTYIDYMASKYITPQAALSKSHKKTILSLCIGLNVLILLTSKYLTFVYAQLAPSLHTWFNLPMTAPNIPLILGISFITFHKISFLVDSYHGRAVPPRHFLDCALYIFLFPQLIAGPIIRYHDIGAQIHDREHSTTLFLAGFFRFSVGLIKKVLLADTLGIMTDKVFNLPTNQLSALFAWGGILAYSLQIYFDFSGYSDMAIGLGRMIGFSFPENFNRPYIARSISEFWQRWHISLSNWMRLYLYIPLGGNRISTLRTYLNLWIVFLISGLWHGASWNFVAWGAYYGFFLCFERLYLSTGLSKFFTLPNIMQRLLTLLIIMVGWVFFRSPSLQYAYHYILTMFNIEHAAEKYVLPWGLIFNHHAIATLIIASCLATLVLPNRTRWLKITNTVNQYIHAELSLSLQFIATITMLIIAAAAIVSADYVPFLYFRF